MAQSPVYRIHPAIGIFRVGSADRSSFFIGPELPGLAATGDSAVGTKVPDFKSGGKLKPQAARFRIWEYVEKNGKLEPSREIDLDQKDCVGIVWNVHLANRKASFFEFDYLLGEDAGRPPRRNASVSARRTLEIDLLPRDIGGRSEKPVEFRKGKSSNPTKELWPDPAPSPAIEYLDELRTDPAGRLIVIGGMGQSSGRNALGISSTGNDPFNNDGWFDDVSDGPVTATLAMKVAGKTKVVPVEGAWVIGGPPDFAPSLANQVTLYDVLYDLAARKMKLPKNEAIFDTVLKPLADLNAELLKGTKLSRYVPSFDEEIYPIISRALETTFTFELPTHRIFHSSLNHYAMLGDPTAATSSARKGLFARLHPPGLAGNDGTRNMPLMHGDAYGQSGHRRFMLTLTGTQYAMMERWKDGAFTATAKTFPPARPAWMSAISPHGLDRAALEHCVGGAFAVGIEVSWQIRNKALYGAPFRVDHKARSQYRGDSKPIKAGHFTRQMALPWQTDFLSCSLTAGLAWWPAQRPDIVFLSTKDFDEKYLPGKFQAWTRPSSSWPSGGTIPSQEEFIEHYYKLGVIRENPRGYHLEKERNDPNVP